MTKSFFYFYQKFRRKKKSFHQPIKEKYPQQIGTDNSEKIIYLQMTRSQNICKFFLLLLYFFQILFSFFFATFIDFKVSCSNTKSIEGLDFTEEKKTQSVASSSHCGAKCPEIAKQRIVVFYVES